MFLAVDVQYSSDDKLAYAAGIIFENPKDKKILEEKLVTIQNPAPYEPGAFYRRELPCILAVVEAIHSSFNLVIIDGYVDLGEKYGLGRYLFNELDQKIPVIGVAKTEYKDSNAIEITRGKSNKPLYITSAGIEPMDASEIIKNMHGEHRIPYYLKEVDRLAREFET